MPAIPGRSGAIAAAVCVVLGAGASVAHAAKAIVTDCSSDADLRAKLAQLQTHARGKLRFSCGANPTIVLSGGPLTITKKIKIDGGPDFVTLSGNNATTLFTVAAGGKATLRRLKLTRGLNVNGDGGAITNLGKLSLYLCFVTDNRSVAAGGAIVSYGKLNVVLSTFESNQALNGGAIYPRFAGSTTTISRSTFTSNKTTSPTDGWGGALLIWDGATVSVDNTSFRSNKARTGGAIYVFGATSVLNSRGTTWSSNSAPDGNGGHVYNQGDFNVTGEDVFNHGRALNGGAIYNAADADLVVTTASFEDNIADVNGGAVYNVSRTTLMHTTLSANYTVPGTVATAAIATIDPPGRGGGVFNRGSMLLENATVSGNSATVGGGLANGAADAFVQILHSTITANSATTGGGVSSIEGKIQATNTIIGDNTSGGDCTAPGGATGTVVSLGFNLSSDTTCSFTKPGDLPDTPAQLNPLAENGGFTRTHMPAAVSDAVDGASGAACVADDQRFTTRPQGAACDIGAVERCTAGKPGPFELLSPVNGGSLDPAAPIDWSDASCASKYLVSLRQDSSTGTPIWTDQPVSASRLAAILSGLEPYTYALQIKACNGKKCRVSPWATFVALPYY